MCEHGNYKIIDIINPCQNKKQVPVDSCISDEVAWLNSMGVITLGSCCGHGEVGQVVEFENDFGKWKTKVNPPHVLIHEDSKDTIEKLGYRAFKYYYADNEYDGVMMVYLKTGDI